jgi:hypothetical protein
MSKRHQASRRRTYGRRQHQLHERVDGYFDGVGQLEEPLGAEVRRSWSPSSLARRATDPLPQLQGA